MLALRFMVACALAVPFVPALLPLGRLDPFERAAGEACHEVGVITARSLGAKTDVSVALDIDIT